MIHMSAKTMRRRLVVSLAAVAATAALSTPARAQEVISKEAAAVLKASFLADLDVMRGKFIGLAEAFPQDKYTWRPMEGVRSVSEVFAALARCPARVKVFRVVDTASAAHCRQRPRRMACWQRHSAR